jgi:transitional endoplasmic reticulum ATPase
MTSNPERPTDARVVAELANVFDEENNARALLERINYPRGRIPHWTAPAAFWRNIFRSLVAGILPGGEDLRPVVIEAAEVYPGNRIFTSWLRHSEKEIAHSEKEIAHSEKEIASIGVVPSHASSVFQVPEVTFEDIGGYEEVKAELGRALQIMTGSFQLPDEKLRRELIPRGFIFHGPPGTGKTLFAKAIANRLNAKIHVFSGPEITDIYVREIFAEARRSAPAALVFDEFDSMVSRRSNRDDGGSRAGNALMAQILTEMEGFQPDVAILIIGTTNRLELIDEALLRPSRFRVVCIGLPDPVARQKIAEVHANRFMIDVSPELLDVIAQATDGLSGDEIRSLFRDACQGQYCESIAADARRLGYLVGRLRLTIDQRRAEAAAAYRRMGGAGPAAARGR